MFVSLLALAAAGQAAAPAAPASGAPTSQQRFDTASRAVDDGRCADAIREFDALEASGATKRSALLAAAVDVRRGRCLLATDRADEGAAAIRRGLPVLVAKGADFTGDVREAQMALGRHAQRTFDYDAAGRAYRAAADLSTGAAQIVPLLRLANVTMFDHDGTALAAAEEARRLALAIPGYDRKDMAGVQTLYARVLLNEGRFKDAYAALKDGLSKQGGLGSKVGAADIATRSDLAIAALKNNDRDNARLYLAYTGAGRMRDTPFTRAAAMDPPTCGGPGGLTPEDQAIVEFSLEDDGHVSGVAPIYTTGRRAAAMAFARAVADWSWRAEDVKNIPALFRYTNRVELRCVRAAGAPELTRPLREATAAWLEDKGAGTPAWDDLSAAAALPVQKAALARAQAAGDQARVLQAALALTASPVTNAEETRPYVAAAMAAAQALRAPVPVRTDVALREPGRAGDREALRAMLADPATAGDPLSAATLRLLIARPGYRSKAPADAATLLGQVTRDGALPANHPLKVAAMLEEANGLAARGDLAAARATFDRTGLTAEQCAQVGLEPAVRRAGGSASDYPMEAVRLGFEGWVRSEFDIGPDGRTIAPRAVIAYPPFVFDDAATGIARDTRYTSTFRPEGALACSGQQQSVLFKLP